MFVFLPFRTAGIYSSRCGSAGQELRSNFMLIDSVIALSCHDFSGDDSEGETPVPIPNTAVKPFSADGTVLVTARESRTSPGFCKTPRSNAGRFLFIANSSVKMNSDRCIFCRIAAHKEPESWIVWEDEYHVAFLTPFPNVPGFTVLATKVHLDSNVFHLTHDRFAEMMQAAKKLAKIMELAMDTPRIALIAEGMGVDHAHVKLIPLLGIDRVSWKPVTSNSIRFEEFYGGYVSSEEGPIMENARLNSIAEAMRSAV